MTGTGTAPTQHTVDLTWNASTDAVGYNVYRGTVPGGPYTMINTSLDSTTAYTDSSVVSGDTYYYVATAVNAGGEKADTRIKRRRSFLVLNVALSTAG